MESLKKDTQAIFNLPPPKSKTAEKTKEGEDPDDKAEDPLIPDLDDVKESLDKEDV